jgi:hypothetical protein
MNFIFSSSNFYFSFLVLTPMYIMYCIIVKSLLFGVVVLIILALYFYYDLELNFCKINFVNIIMLLDSNYFIHARHPIIASI